MRRARRHLVAPPLLALLLAAALSGCHDDPAPPQPSTDRSTDADSISRYNDTDGKLASQRFGFDHIEPPAPKPTGPLAADASCVTPACHSAFATTKRVHAPAGQGQCDACHAADTGGHRYPLKRHGADTCKFCHMLPTNEHEHPPVSDPGCTTCHDPHFSQARYLLTEATTGQVCDDCHNLPLDQHAHASFAAGQCGLCHNPHGANNVKLLRGGSGPQFCLSCHTDLARQIAEQQLTHSPLLHGDCTQCHQPHTSPNPRLLVNRMDKLCFTCHEHVGNQIAHAKVRHGAIGEDGQCANCHDAHAAPQPYLLQARQDAICLRCHDQPQQRKDGEVIPSVAAELEMPYLHGPVRSAECSGCHQTHGSDHAYLLDADYPRTFYASFSDDRYKLCFQCHTQQMVLAEQTEALTDFRDGTRNLHYVHVNREDKGRSCRTCHEVHGSQRPRHIAESVPFEGSGWAMPIEYKKLTDGGSCSPGCHEPMTYKRSAANTNAAMRGGS